MTRKTESELLFEAFCAQNDLDCHRIPTGAEKTCDYMLSFGAVSVLVEIEQIESEKGFTPNGVSSRTVGAHVRHKISEARRQIKTARDANLPALLLIHNTVDPLQAFGTETHDFICAMYGELTVSLVNGRVHDSYHGRNAKLRNDENTYFSGVGHLQRLSKGASVKVFENVFAERPLPFDAMPGCIEVVRVEVEHAA